MNLRCSLLLHVILQVLLGADRSRLPDLPVDDIQAIAYTPRGNEVPNARIALHAESELMTVGKTRQVSRQSVNPALAMRYIAVVDLPERLGNHVGLHAVGVDIGDILRRQPQFPDDLLLRQSRHGRDGVQSTVILGSRVERIHTHRGVRLAAAGLGARLVAIRPLLTSGAQSG
jgi:hypothetical protein